MAATRSDQGWLITALVCGLAGCGGPPSAARPDDAGARAELEGEAVATPSPARSQPKADAAPAGPDLRKPPWARKNDKRLDAIAEAIELNDVERETITSLWSAERVEILRLIKTHRESGNPDWKLVQEDVVALRASNDATVRELLGDERFAVYLEHRPAVSPGAKPTTL